LAVGDFVARSARPGLEVSVKIIHGLVRGKRGVPGAAFLLALGLVAQPAASSARTASAAYDSLSRDDLFLFPKAPCAQDTVTVFVRGYVSTPCDSFVGAEKTGPNSIVIRQQIYAYRQCLAAPFQFFSVPVVMGTFPVGSNSIEIVHEVVGIGGDHARDTTRTSTTLTFDVAPVCQPPAPVPADDLPFVLRVGTVPSPPCPGQPVTIRMDGAFLDQCGSVVSVDPENFSLTIAPYSQPYPCALALKPWSVEFPLGSLAAGHFRVLIHMTVLGSDAAWPPVTTQTYVGVFDFDVPRICPAPSSLPYVDFIGIQSRYPCPQPRALDPAGPVCAGDSILVLMGGRFPSSCYRVAKVELVDQGYASPLPMPPLVRFYVTDQGCTRIACSTDSVPWVQSVMLGPLIARDYGLMVQEVRVLGCPTVPVDTTSTTVPFTVIPQDQCPPIHCGCVSAEWLSPTDASRCAAAISPGGAASITMGVRTPVALAGLQGTLFAGGAGLRITKLEAVGAAQGMSLSWSKTTREGVRFVMFTTQGTPIPATLSGPAASVLRVTVELALDSPDLVYHVDAHDLLGSDVQGNAVPSCVLIGAIVPPSSALICVTRGECDFNADRQVDVRDLVLMVRCIRGDGPCPPDAATRFDCDADSSFDLGDVICCAMDVLRDTGCTRCPADSMREEPGIGIDFAKPVATATGLDLPLHLRGRPLVGAVRLQMRFPSDRFYLAGVETPGALGLHEVDGDEIALGLIGPFAAIDPIDPRPPDVVLHLALRPGRSAGGEASVVGAEFSGPDGVALRVALGQPSVSLGPTGSGLQLSRAAPNPFSGQTRFSVTVDRSAALDVGVYDLAGRRIASLFKGTVPAGTHPFTWNGRTDDGAPARGGVYFYRAMTDNAAATGRMILLQAR
jgi:hypothetical protein